MIFPPFDACAPLLKAVIGYSESGKSAKVSDGVTKSLFSEPFLVFAMKWMACNVHEPVSAAFQNSDNKKVSN